MSAAHRLDERDARADERRELARHHRDVADGRAVQERAEVDRATALLACARPPRCASVRRMPSRLQQRAQRLRVVRVADALDRLAGGDEIPRYSKTAMVQTLTFGRSTVSIDLMSSCVAARTSSTVVRPREHLARAVVAQAVHALL